MVSEEESTPQAETSCRVFYDGACPLCRREIAFYRRREGETRIDWVDVSAADYRGGNGAPDPETARKRFHVVSARGELVAGGAAFAELWSMLPGFRAAGRLFRIPPFSWAVALAYRLFLPLRPALQKLAAKGE
ncbi:MAG: DUF393 domain-containing protein [Parvibaculum sp.]|uniref:thiol-disulfide oxidoreductase DCC family protein n=1 Tax=Parvibaculum sp. TaxID=2024848 RepID=UPI001B1B8D0B|nr:DUF393 domain-containing protein [Parvibaculum sp.]MBO6634719.1 DUF393 domain-containing protein [Parvibaculum sp.]MBO6677773.1 DUF393 domain-containing protein [Parvibaculum sp.]MBO6684770.1 DUF393 domain-containing protein [Parvibaculum sp.]MBO6904807.1 DUF393 domain-containing protein [Parvibaculum sp.]